MTDHRTIHGGNMPGAHPSVANPGVHEYTCDVCGATVRYAQQLGEWFVWHDGEDRGARDIGTGEDLCLRCARKYIGGHD